LERDLGLKNIAVVEKLKCIYNVKKKKVGRGMIVFKGNQQIIQGRGHMQISHQQNASPL